MTGPETGAPPTGPRLSDRLAVGVLVALAELLKRIPRQSDDPDHVAWWLRATVTGLRLGLAVWAVWMVLEASASTVPPVMVLVPAVLLVASLAAGIWLRPARTATAEHQDQEH